MLQMIEGEWVWHIEILVYSIGEQTCTARALHAQRSFNMRLTSAKGQKLESFKWTPNNIFGKQFEHLANPLSNKVISIFYLTQVLSLSLCVYYNLYDKICTLVGF